MNQQIYQQVTDRIIGLLEQGVIPWKSPYLATVGLPCNFVSGKPYQGINAFLLSALRFTSPYFLTFLQTKELGGHIRKGERGFLVIKYGTYLKESESPDAEEVKCRYLKAYTVFHASQTEGIAFPDTVLPDPVPSSECCSRASAIAASMPNPPSLQHGSAEPFYRPATDSVHMPEPQFFVTSEAYHSTLFHELSHATGHASRLARKSLLDNKGIHAGGESRKTYAEEELVAEMSAAFLNAHAGIVEAEIENSAAYLQGWITALKSQDAKGWIIRAASQAQRAANYILNAPEDGHS